MAALPPVLIDVNRAHLPFLGIWIGAGVLALIFVPPLLFKLFSERLAGSGPLWVYLALGVGLPVTVLAVGYILAYANSNDFDRVAVHDGSLSFRHSLTRKVVEVPLGQLVGWEQEIVEPPTLDEPQRYVFVARLRDGRALRSESAESTVHTLSMKRLAAELGPRGLPTPAW